MSCPYFKNPITFCESCNHFANNECNYKNITELKRLLTVAQTTIQIRGYNKKSKSILETIESEYIGIILSNNLDYECRFNANLEDLLDNSITIDSITEF